MEQDRSDNKCQNGSRDRGHYELLAELEPLFASSVGFAKQLDQTMVYQSGSQTLCLRSQSTCKREWQHRDREAVAQSLLGLLVPAPPPTPPVARRSGTLDNTTDMCDITTRGSKHEGGVDWPQNTNKVRLTTYTTAEEAPTRRCKGRRRGGSRDS